jgi:hypothetical protein
LLLKYFKNIKDQHNIEECNIFAMDETAIWINSSGETTIDIRGSKSIPIISTEVIN